MFDESISGEAMDNCEEGESRLVHRRRLILGVGLFGGESPTFHADCLRTPNTENKWDPSEDFL